MTSKRPRLFYGWLIVFVSAVGLFLGPPLMIFSFTVFFKPLVQDFHASRAAISFAFSIFNTVGALFIPCTGLLIDRFGARRIILVSTVLYALLLCSSLWIGTSLWQLYLWCAVLGIAFSSGPAPVPHGVVISHWFNRRRGFALGLAMMGIGVGSLIVPNIAQRLIVAHGWRMTFALFGVATLLLPLPVLWALLQNDPAERGLRPDGDAEAPASRQAPQDQQGLTWHEIWHSPLFWIMVCAFSLAGASVHGALLHLSAILTDSGLTPERAALATSLVGVAVVIGRLGSGYLLDRFFAPRVAILFYGATALGMAILCVGTGGTLPLIAAFLIGLGLGAEVETMGYLISRYFGLRAFGSAYGHAFGAFMISGATGVLLMGAGYDRFHSYTIPLACFCAAIIVGLVLLTRLGPYRFGVEAETSRPTEPVEVASGA